MQSAFVVIQNPCVVSYTRERARGRSAMRCTCGDPVCLNPRGFKPPDRHAAIVEIRIHVTRLWLLPVEIRDKIAKHLTLAECIMMDAAMDPMYHGQFQTTGALKMIRLAEPAKEIRKDIKWLSEANRRTREFMKIHRRINNKQDSEYTRADFIHISSELRENREYFTQKDHVSNQIVSLVYHALLDQEIDGDCTWPPPTLKWIKAARDRGHT